MVGHGGSSADSYLADPTSPIPSHCASIVATSTFRVNLLAVIGCAQITSHPTSLSVALNFGTQLCSCPYWSLLGRTSPKTALLMALSLVQMICALIVVCVYNFHCNFDNDLYLLAQK